MSARTVSRTLDPKIVIEGAGVKLRRSISPERSNLFDPFLLFDHFIFQDPIEGPIAGFPYHPHRGIETVTYMLAGSTYHRDSLGNAGLIGPGDVQWMTSGRGILHEEMPRRNADGKVDGFQLWVNLPKARKMVPPRYQEVSTVNIPEITSSGTTARVIAGKVCGTQGPVTEIAAHPLYVDLTVEAGASFTQCIPVEHTVIAYVFHGSCRFDTRGDIVCSVCLAVLEKGDHIEVHSDNGVRLMLISGAPFGEPIMPYGPFVMNTKEEIQQALQDLREGTFVDPSPV
jgi:hypothetical protein